MSITKCKDSKGRTKYRVFVDIGRLPDGSRDRKTAVCSTEKDAKRTEFELKMLKHNLGGQSNRITFREFVDGYFLKEKRQVLHKNTMEGYERDIKLRLMPAFGHLLIGDITRHRIQVMIDGCPTYKTGKNARDTLSAILGYALDSDLVKRNQARGKYRYKQKPPAGQNNLGVVVSSFDEHVRLISLAQGYSERAILVLGFCFGLRKGEIAGLDWEHIDLDGRQIHIVQSYTQSTGGLELAAPKTPKSIRDLPVNDFAYMQLKALRDFGGIIRVKGPVLVHNQVRMKPKRLYKEIVAFRDRDPDIGAITPSSLRHSFATAAILRGINVASVSKWLGHTNVSTTLNRYVIPLMGDLRDDAERINAFYFEAKKTA